MSALLESIRGAKAAGDPNRIAAAIPYARWLGFEVELVESELRGRLRFSPPLIGNASLPALHGGTLGALLESTAIVEVLWRMETLILPKTITITIDFLRPGRPVDVQARAIVTRQGRRVANVRAEAWQEDPARPIATANALFLVLADPA